MTCDYPEIEDCLEAYADAELAPAERRGLEEHARGCPECRRRLALALALKAAVRRAPAPAMPPELAASLHARAQRLSRPPIWRVWLAGLRARRPAAYGLAAGFAAAAALLVVRLAQPETVTLPLDVLLAAHGDCVRAMPLAPEAAILSQLPGRWEGPR